MNQDPDTYRIIGAAMEVHRELNHGFLEAVYQEALEEEFKECDIPYCREYNIEIRYKANTLRQLYRADFVCFDSVIVELKSIRKITVIEEAQLLNYLKATGFKKRAFAELRSREPGSETIRFVRTRSV